MFHCFILPAISIHPRHSSYVQPAYHCYIVSSSCNFYTSPPLIIYVQPAYIVSLFHPSCNFYTSPPLIICATCLHCFIVSSFLQFLYIPATHHMCNLPTSGTLFHPYAISIHPRHSSVPYWYHGTWYIVSSSCNFYNFYTFCTHNIQTVGKRDDVGLASRPLFKKQITSILTAWHGNNCSETSNFDDKCLLRFRKMKK